MPNLLTPQQSNELHKSMIAYCAAHGLGESCNSLRRELGSTNDQFDATTEKKYESLLERKWSSNSRLQRRILELESHNSTLQQELHNMTPASLLKRKIDAIDWLPRRAIFTLESHRESLNCIAFHPIFSSMASGADDYAIKIWNYEHGELEATLKGHTKAVRDVDYGRTSSGIVLASCSSDQTIKLWDPKDDYKNTRTLQGHDHIVSSVRFIPSRNLLASASRDTQVKLWNTDNGHCVGAIDGHTGWVREIFPSADGKCLLSTGDDMTVRLWDVSGTHSECKMTAIGHENFNTCCAIAPPASFQYIAPWLGLKKQTSPVEFMATGSRDKTIKVWNCRGVCIMNLVGHDNWVRAIAFHPGGKYLLSVSDDKTLRCWDLSQQGKCVKTISDDNFITCLKWAPSIRKDIHKVPADEEGGLNMQIRCLVATGNANKQVNIFAG